MWSAVTIVNWDQVSDQNTTVKFVTFKFIFDSLWLGGRIPFVPAELFRNTALNFSDDYNDLSRVKIQIRVSAG